MKNWNNIGAVVLYSLEHKNGIRYDNLEDAVASLRRRYWHTKNPIDYCNVKGYNHFSSHTWMSGTVTWSVYGDDYLIKDDLDLVIPRWKVLEVYNSLPEPVYRYWRYRGPYKFRDGPVPGCGWRRGGRHGKGYVWQALKADYFDRFDDDLKEYKFKRRNYEERFHAFRDWERHSNWGERNWKEYRKTRWK